MGFSYSSSSSAGSNLASNAIGAALNMAIPQNSHDSSDTQSSIAQGTIIVRDNPNQDLSSIDRSATTLDGNGVSSDFDVDKIKEKQALGQAAGYVGMRAAGDLAKYEHDRAQADWLAAPQGSDAEADAKARLAQWSDGGTYKTILHGAVGAGIAALGGGDPVKGALGAAASEKASGVMQDYLIEHGYDPNKGTGKVLMELASTAIGGAAGGGAGAATALKGELYNRQLHDWEHKLAKELAVKSNGEYTWQEIEDAMRNSSYGSPNAPVVDFGMGDNVGKGNLYAYTPAGTAEVIMSWSTFSQQGGTLDPGSSFTFPTSQNPGLYGYGSDVMAVQAMPGLNRGAADFIATHMADADIQKSYGSQFDSDYGSWQYTWQPEQKISAPVVSGYEPQQQGVRGNNMTFYDTMLGRVVTIGVSGVCATAECAMKGGNFDMDDPRTKQYLSDVGHAQLKFGATVASAAVGGAWANLAKEGVVAGWMAYSGAGATSAGANAAAQYLTTGTVRAPDVIFAGATGTFGGWAARLPGWQAPLSMMMANTGGAAANTVIDNAVYGENESIGDAMFTSGLGTVGGYKIGNYAEGSNMSPWIVNSISAFSSEFVTRKSNDILKNVQSEQSASKDKGKNP
jgi:filamentous hemagglutinin